MMQEKGMEITEKGIGLSELEFAILCNVSSVRDLVCFEQKRKKTDEEESLQTILDMVKRGLLIHSEDTFFLSPEMRSFMLEITNRKFTLLLRSKESEALDCCIYIGEGEEVVLAEPGARGEEYVILKLLPKSVLGVFIENGNYIPDAEISTEINEIRKKVEGNEGSGVEFTQVGKEGPKEYRFRADLYSGSQDALVNSLYVVWDKGNELMIEVSGDDASADYYDSRRLLKRILQLIGL